MNHQEAAVVAAWDQFIAVIRDDAERCKAIHDQYIRAGFSPDHAMELTQRRLDAAEGWCHDDD